MMTACLTREDALIDILRYDPETGALFRTDKKYKRPIGSRWRGYIRVRVLGVYTYAHMIVWRMHKGHWPKRIYFRDGDGYNCRIENLSDESLPWRRNREDDYIPADEIPDNIRRVHENKYVAFARIAGVTYPLGPYPTFDDARSALAHAQNRV